MKVSATDKGTGKSSSVTIENERGRLSTEDIERMVAESEQFAEEDELIKKKIESRNALENCSFSLPVAQIVFDDLTVANMLNSHLLTEGSTR